VIEAKPGGSGFVEMPQARKKVLPVLAISVFSAAIFG